MTGDQIAILNTIAAILDKIGSWPLPTILVVLVAGPWLAMIAVTLMQSKRFEAVVKMYENNVKLVEALEKIAGEQQEVILLNTQKMTHVGTMIENNLYCPLVRKNAKQKEVDG